MWVRIIDSKIWVLWSSVIFSGPLKISTRSSYQPLLLTHGGTESLHCFLNVLKFRLISKSGFFPSLSKFDLQHVSWIKYHLQQIFRVKFNNTVGLLGKCNFFPSNQPLRGAQLCHVVTSAEGSTGPMAAPLMDRTNAPRVDRAGFSSNITQHPSLKGEIHVGINECRDKMDFFQQLTVASVITPPNRLYLTPRSWPVFLSASSERHLLSYSLPI